MPKKSIKKLRAAAKSSKPEVKAKAAPDSLRKKPLGKKARLAAKRNGTFDVMRNSSLSKLSEKKLKLSALEQGLIKNNAKSSKSSVIKSAAAASGQISNKLKGAVAVRETERMKMVMAHPGFSLALVKEHLKQAQQARKK